MSAVKGYDDGIKAGFNSFVKELTDRGFIVRSDAPSVPARLSFDELTESDLNFVLNEYREASELLLADPIHQVKEETGWKPSREVLK